MIPFRSDSNVNADQDVGHGIISSMVDQRVYFLTLLVQGVWKRAVRFFDRNIQVDI